MNKTRSRKSTSKLKLWLLVLIILSTGLVITLYSSPQVRNLLRAQLRSITPVQLSQTAEQARNRLDHSPYVGGYWPDVYKRIYIDGSNGKVSDVYKSPLIDMFTCARNFPEVFTCLTTTPLDEYYAKKFAAECKAMYPKDPWTQILCVTAQLRDYYDTTKTNECCRHIAGDLEKIIPLLEWGGATVTISQEALALGATPPNFPRGHIFNRISITTPSGPFPGKTYSFMYDGGWFPRYFYPADHTTRSYYNDHSQWSFPYYPSSSNEKSKTPPPNMSPKDLPVPPRSR